MLHSIIVIDASSRCHSLVGEVTGLARQIQNPATGLVCGLLPTVPSPSAPSSSSSLAYLRHMTTTKRTMRIMVWAAALSSSIAAAATTMLDIRADSVLGTRLMQHARRLNQDNKNQQDESQEQYAWVSSYSVKFQGCLNIKQWNVHADADEDVRIATKSLVRFRLCPTNTCSASKAAGCTSGYGDYIIDLSLYMVAHMEAVRQFNEVNCENYLNAKCSCDNDNDCKYNCFNDAGMTECIDGEQQQFQVEDYMECSQIKANGQHRQLGGGGEQQVKYYVGPYCGNQGGDVYLGLFTDDSCTEFAEDVDFESLMGYELPYKSTSLVSSKCVQCSEPVRDQQNENQNNDEIDADQVNESCESLYLYSGKCESNLPSSMVTDRNENGCNYMEGIKIVRYDGIIDRSSVRPSAIATAFIVIFAMAFSAMAFYVWYLRTRLGVKQNTFL
jgi:hypothetical protein